ncbi:unnamed protein product [Victoria cruziana]
MASHTVSVTLAVIFCLLGFSQEGSSDDSFLGYNGNLPIKTLATATGDIVDCVNIHDQPAFSNRVRRNHRIQMRPSSYPHEKDVKGNLDKMAADIFRTSLTTVNCPFGTVPILRPRKQNPDISEYARSRKRNPFHSEIAF